MEWIISNASSPGQLESAARSALGVKLGAGIVGNVDPHVHVWHTAKMPDERGPFNAPHVPFAVITQIERSAALSLAIEGEMAGVEAPLRVEHLHRFGLVGPPVRLDERFQHVFGVFLLVAGKLGNRDSWDRLPLAFKFDLALLRRDFDQGLFSLLAREHLEQLVGLLRLVPEDISRMSDRLVESRRGMPIKD